MSRKIFYITLIGCCLPLICAAQLLHPEIQHKVIVDHGVSIFLIPSVDEPKQYYYIPSTLQLAQSKGYPEASLLFYREKNNSFGGGILHLLFSWGLTPQQEQKAKQSLLDFDSTGILMGPAEISFSDDDQLEFTSNTSLGQLLKTSVSSPIKVSAMASNKTAASFRLNADAAETLWNSIQSKSTQTTKMGIEYSYKVAEQAGHMRIGVNRHGRMETQVEAWIKTLTKYNLIKNTSI